MKVIEPYLTHLHVKETANSPSHVSIMVKKEEYYEIVTKYLQKIDKLKSLVIAYSGNITTVHTVRLIGSLTNLVKLSLTAGKIIDANELYSLTNLESLDLAGNNIKYIDKLMELTKLESLNLAYNHLEKLDCISHLTRLKTLTLRHNNIIDIDPLSNITTLEILGLDRNRIVRLDALRSLTNLVILELDHNNIETIEPLSGLTKLEYLKLNDNRQFVSIRPLEQMTRLIELNLKNNLVEDIESLAKMTRLTELNIEHNMITNLRPLYNMLNINRLLFAFNNIDMRDRQNLADALNASIEKNCGEVEIPSLYELVGAYVKKNFPPLKLGNGIVPDDIVLAFPNSGYSCSKCGKWRATTTKFYKPCSLELNVHYLCYNCHKKSRLTKQAL